ncbi:MAG: hypothetical protein NVS9B4_21580 [Candidatus Acidiferrum sp.]
MANLKGLFTTLRGIMLKEIAKAGLASGSGQKLLEQIDCLALGHKLLNKLSNPRGVFNTFEQAATVASQTGAPGHENPGSVATHMALLEKFRPSDYPVLHWINYVCLPQMRVTDYGGNAGNLYYSYRPYLHSEKVCWAVLDLPTIVDQGRAIAAERRAEELRFLPSTMRPFPACDFALISGAFHFWEGTPADFVNRFEEHPEHVIINRTPLLPGEAPQYSTVQFSEYSSFPCIVRNRNQVIASFRGEGYHLVDSWNCPELSLKKILFPRQSIDQYSGLYFRLH